MKGKQLAVAIARAFGEKLNRHALTYMHRTGLALFALPPVIDSPEDVDEAYRGFYKPYKDGKWIADGEGLDGDPRGFKSALERERQRAERADREAREAREQLKRFDGIDPEVTRQLLQQAESEEERRLLAEGPGGIQKLVDLRTRKAVENAERMVRAKDGEIQQRDQQLNEVQQKAEALRRRSLNAEIVRTGMKLGLHEGGVEDAMLQAAAEGWTTDDEGKPVLKDK